MDKTLCLTEHINEMWKKDSYAIRSIGRIRKYLPSDGLKMLVNFLVISRLDYCNSLLYDIPKYQRDRLQRIQNTAARMITGARSSDHITPLLKSLHWLTVEARIHFKILLITYKILNGKSAGYLKPLIKDYHPSRALRSSSHSLLCTPAIKSKHMEDARFPLQHLSYGTLSQNLSKMQTVLLNLKQNLKNFYSGNISIDFYA